MSLNLYPSINVPISSIIESQPVTLTGLSGEIGIAIGSNSSIDNISGVSIVRNGINTNSKFAQASNGDTISIRGTAPSTYNTVVFSSVDFGGEVTSVFAIVTEPDPASKVADPDYIGLPPNQLFSDYTQVNPNNKFKIIDTFNDAVSSSNLVTVGQPDPSITGNGNDYVLCADMLNDKLHKVDVVDGIVVQSFSIPSPYGVSYTPTSSNTSNTITHTLVTSPDSNSVYVIDGSTDSIIHQVAVGSNPTGIQGAHSSTKNSFGFWVCCTDADRVEYWKYTSGVSLAREYYYTLEEGSKPFDVILHDNGDAIVSCLGTHKVVLCPVGGNGALSYIELNNSSPWSLCKDGNYIYVACSDSSYIDVIELTTSNVTSMEVMYNPSHVCIAAGKLYVGSFNSGILNSYVMNTPTTLGSPVELSTGRLLFGLSSNLDQSYVYALALYNDSPERLAFPDNTPSQFTPASKVNITPETLVTSDTLTVNGINAGPALIKVPDIFNMTILVNGVDVGTEASVSNGDTIAFMLVSPVQSQDIFIPIVGEGFATSFIVFMEPGANSRVAGWMHGG